MIVAFNHLNSLEGTERLPFISVLHLNVHVKLEHTIFTSFRTVVNSDIMLEIVEEINTNTNGDCS